MRSLVIFLSLFLLMCSSNEKIKETKTSQKEDISKKKANEEKKKEKLEGLAEAERSKDITIYNMRNLQGKSKLRATSGGRSSQSIQSFSSRSGQYRPIERSYLPRDDKFNTEDYAHLQENALKNPLETALSTFSIDVDGASYANARRFIRNGKIPPKDAIRVEEFINYFSYDYPNADKEEAFSLSQEWGNCPWNPKAKLLHIALKGKSLKTSELKRQNLVFLLDVSGSMNSANKLPLLKKSFRLLVNQLGENDKVAIVVYAGAAGCVLESTSDKGKILNALEKLSAGGSTAGGAGIQLAYQIANREKIEAGNNRIILATDGDFNVGQSSEGALIRLIEKERSKGVFLSVLGFGMGNYKDSKMELLSNKGNGNYAYIDNLLEAKKVLVNEVGATLQSIAKDVKIQIEFNPLKVKAYRLIGYENRLLNTEDFRDDTKDAGEIGAGHTVTVLYEIIPNRGKEEKPNSLIFQKSSIKKNHQKSQNIAYLKLRYKEPNSDRSKLLKYDVLEKINKRRSENFIFSAAVAEFAMLLRDSKFKEQSSYENVIKLAKMAKGKDPFGYRAEFIQLVEMLRLLKSPKEHY